jgi:hypothetical protein
MFFLRSRIAPKAYILLRIQPFPEKRNAESIDRHSGTQQVFQFLWKEAHAFTGRDETSLSKNFNLNPFPLIQSNSFQGFHSSLCVFKRLGEE